MRLFFLLLFAGLFAGAQPTTITWPRHKKAVIVLTYDDALKSQLDNAIPQLDSMGFKGTFFLIGDALNFITIPQWRQVAKKGHELANHTLYHPCISTSDNPVGSQNYTPNTIVREIGLMNYFLYSLDGKTSHAYAYPCTETSVGGKDYVDTLKRSQCAKYARIGGDKDAVITDFQHLNPLLIPSYGLEGNNSAAQLIAFVDNVVKKGGMGVFMFHGIGGDYITTPLDAHRALLEYLKKNKKDIWVTTLSEAMDYVTNATKAK
jgi:peptidoglycan/xylan/chitin deacetylase (PgdA/CDA1 family)